MTRIRIFDTDFVELYDSLTDERSVEAFLAIEYADSVAQWFPAVVDYPSGERWSGRIDVATGAAVWQPDSDYLKREVAWPPLADWQRRQMTDRLIALFDGMRPALESVGEFAADAGAAFEKSKAKHAPPMWAIDPARSKRPKRNRSQPSRQAVR